MAKFAIGYQLNKQKDYPRLWDEMKRLGAHKAMNSFYLASLTNETADSVRDHLKSFIDQDDMIFVARMDARPASWKCFQGTQAWIDGHF